MVWLKIDDGFYSHPKVLSIPRSIRAAAIGTFTLAGAWSARHLTDGIIPDYMLDELGSPDGVADALVTAGLWETTDGGYRFRSWAEYQPTRVQVEAARDAERRRKADWRDRKKTPTDGVPEMSHRDNPVRPDGTTPSVPGLSRHPDPTRPDPTRPKEQRDPTDVESLLSDGTADAAPSDPPSTALALIDTPKTPAQSSGYPAGFEKFWAAFPRHEGKRKAFTAWQAARKRATNGEQTILDGATRYRDDPNREDAYTAHPTTWLNRDGWHDAPLPQRRPDNQQDRLAASAARMFHDLNAQTRGA